MPAAIAGNTSNAVSAAIKAASEKLNEVWQAASAELYKSASEKRGQAGAQPEPEAGPQPGSESAEGPKDEGVIDAEVVDEKK